jgi:hypothetical protein
MAGSIDTRSPELAYLTKNNIIVPKTDARAATAIRDLASQHDRANVITLATVTISGADPAATRTYVAPTKEA